jgi:hypothetical protein
MVMENGRVRVARNAQTDVAAKEDKPSDSMSKGPMSMPMSEIRRNNANNDRTSPPVPSGNCIATMFSLLYIPCSCLFARKSLEHAADAKMGEYVSSLLLHA